MTRLLFVDDEPRVLQGLRLSLRSKRKVWDMVFVEGGVAAIAELERGDFDAVVSDMRMPGMDGAELLHHVRKMQPDAIRVVLSGQMEEAAAARASRAAHRFLAKPCDSDVLVTTLSRALELREQFESVQMRKCLGGMASLPSLPAACLALNRALEEEGSSLNEVTRIIENDVGMSTKVLQLVNSAFFGLSRRLTSVSQAVKHLGLNAVRSLVLAQAMFQELAGDDLALLETEQTRSLLAAKFARRFPLDRDSSEVAVTAALLHNAGRLALISRLPEERDAIRESRRPSGMSPEQAERRRLGVSHAEVGAYLLGLWGLPHEVIEAVGTHDAPLDDRGRLDASAVVHVAEALASEALGQGSSAACSLAHEALKRWGVRDIVSALRDEIATANAKETASP